MSEENKLNGSVEGSGGSNSQDDPKLGCGARLGIFLLIIAVITVLLVLIVKPELESRGVDVDGKLQRLKTQAGELADTLQNKAEDTRDELQERAETVQEKTEDAVENAKDAAGNAAEKAADTAGSVKEQVESWY